MKPPKAAARLDAAQPTVVFLRGLPRTLRAVTEKTANPSSHPTNAPDKHDTKAIRVIFVYIIDRHQATKYPTTNISGHALTSVYPTLFSSRIDVLYHREITCNTRRVKFVPRLPAVIRISLKKRGGKTYRIELIRQPTGRRFWIRKDGKYRTRYIGRVIRRTFQGHGEMRLGVM